MRSGVSIFASEPGTAQVSTDTSTIHVTLTLAPIERRLSFPPLAVVRHFSSEVEGGEASETC